MADVYRYGVPTVMEEAPLASRLAGFTEWFERQGKPTLPEPETFAEAGPAMMRAAVQWQNFLDHAIEVSRNYSLPLEEAERVVGRSLHG